MHAYYISGDGREIVGAIALNSALPICPAVNGGHVNRIIGINVHDLLVYSIITGLAKSHCLPMQPAQHTKSAAQSIYSIHNIVTFA